MFFGGTVHLVPNKLNHKTINVHWRIANSQPFNWFIDQLSVWFNSIIQLLFFYLSLSLLSSSMLFLSLCFPSSLSLHV